MAEYTPPLSTNIPFGFTSEGYVSPNSENIPFRFGLRPVYQQTADLNGFIRAFQPRDLGATIVGVQVVAGSEDLGAYIKSTIQATANLGAYTKSTVGGYRDLGAAIKKLGRGTEDLPASLHGWATFDLPAYIGAHPPVDLFAYLNVIEIRNLLASITGILLQGSADLGATVPRIFQRSYVNLGAYLKSSFDIADLQGIINIISIANLPAVIRSRIRDDLDLNAYLQARQYRDLGAALHGWAEQFLPATINGVYGPYDLQAYIRVHPHANLIANISGWHSGAHDLPAFLGGWEITNLNAVIGAIPCINLGAYIFAIGKIADLPASITPNMIRIRRAIQVSLMEHGDLKALINFQCFGSNSIDLPAYLKALYKLDLSASIWGARPADYFANLGAYINSAAYIVEDKLPIRFVPEIRKHTQLRLRFGVNDTYYTFDTLPLIFGTFNGSDLNAIMTGVLNHVDLTAFLTPILQANYSELPDYIDPRINVMVIDFNDHMRENWRRFVEIMFVKDGDDPFHYIYASGAGQIYRLDRSRHWTIWVKSYVEVENDIIERSGMRSKYIFNLDNYSTMDEAITDFIDRVSDYRKADISAAITGVMPPYIDLSASITPRVIVRHWMRSLRATITGI